MTLYVLFVVYASLLPWRFARPSEPPGSVISSAWAQPASHVSRSDFAANVLLFVPIGFLGAAALIGTPTRRRWIVAALTVACAATLVSAVIEGIQLFVPGRIFTPTDVVAETLGATFGLAGWMVYGPELSAWLKTLRRPATRGRELVLGVLAVYAAVFVGSQVAPLELTADVSKLAQKYREGDIVFMPFTSSIQLDELTIYALMAAPIGGLIAFTAGPRVQVLSLWLVSIAALCVLELVQLPIIGQRTESIDIIVGSVGTLLGIVIARRFLPRGALGRTVTRHDIGRPLAWATIVIWVVAVAAEQWWPFGFRQDYEFVRQRLQSLPLMPLQSLYSAPISQAASRLLWKFCLGLPLGLLLTIAWPQNSGHRFEQLRIGMLSLAAIAVFGLIEAGQLFLPTRDPDPTDVLIEIAGVMAGMYAASAMRRTAVEFR